MSVRNLDMVSFAREHVAPVLAELDGRPGEKVALMIVACVLAEGLSSDDFDTAIRAAAQVLDEYTSPGGGGH